VNNPYKARYTVTNWLERLTADSHNAAKLWVAARTYEEAIQEKDEKKKDSSFVKAQLGLNDDLPTEHSKKGAPKLLGVTIMSASLVNVLLEGNEAVKDSATAVIVAKNNADALVETAKGDKKARITRAEGIARETELTYGAVKQFGELGLALSQVDAIKSPGDGKVVLNLPFLRDLDPAKLMEQLRNAPKTPTAPPSGTAGTTAAPEETREHV
jgi:regulator of protease activity HflC (stomatin/prohibitin superfamily)